MTAESNQCVEDDGEVAVVGLGNPPIWLCLRHFDERMAKIGATVRRLREAMTDG